MIFFNVGSNLASKIPKGKLLFNTYLRKSCVNSFFINPVQEFKEIREIDKQVLVHLAFILKS